MLAKALAAATAAAGLDITELFSTSLYTGNSSTQTITNGIDLAGEGGLVWIKSTTNTTQHCLFDTARGANKALVTNSTAAQDDLTSLGITAFTSFNSSGFTLGDDVGYSSVNTSSRTYASWTFRKQAKFFDVVTYTGTGSARTVAHNLGSVPGCIIVKRTDAVDNWTVYHTSLGNTKYLQLNQTAAAGTDISRWNNTTPTSTVFTVGTDAAVNASGGTYVAYLFAHETGPNDVIQCGSYTGNGSASGPTITLGWEPQWLLIKNASGAYNWWIADTERGIPTGGFTPLLAPNTNGAESYLGEYINVSGTGFQLVTANANVNQSGSTFIYVAIRSAPA